MSLENAKKLLKKAIELQDEELVDMASQALSAIYGQQNSENINLKSAEPESPKYDPAHDHDAPDTTEDVFTGNIDFMPNGYWEYEIYEVSWQDGGTPTVATGYAPINETDVLTPPAADKGIVQGRVEIGKLYITEATGQEEVQYEEYVRPTQTNYIYVS